jgi:hypothetical protein
MIILVNALKRAGVIRVGNHVQDRVILLDRAEENLLPSNGQFVASVQPGNKIFGCLMDKIKTIARDGGKISSQFDQANFQLNCEDGHAEMMGVWETALATSIQDISPLNLTAGTHLAEEELSHISTLCRSNIAINSRAGSKSSCYNNDRILFRPSEVSASTLFQFSDSIFYNYDALSFDSSQQGDIKDTKSESDGSIMENSELGEPYTNEFEFAPANDENESLEEASCCSGNSGLCDSFKHQAQESIANLSVMACQKILKKFMSEMLSSNYGTNFKYKTFSMYICQLQLTLVLNR